MFIWTEEGIWSSESVFTSCTILYEKYKENEIFHDIIPLITCLNFWEMDAVDEIWEGNLGARLQKCSAKKSLFVCCKKNPENLVISHMYLKRMWKCTDVHPF